LRGDAVPHHRRTTGPVAPLLVAAKAVTEARLTYGESVEGGKKKEPGE